MRATCRGTRAVRLRKAERGNYSKRPDAVSEARRGPGQNVEVGLPPHARALLRALSVGAAQGWRKGALVSLGCRPPPAVVSPQGRRLHPGDRWAPAAPALAEGIRKTHSGPCDMTQMVTSSGGTAALHGGTPSLSPPGPGSGESLGTDRQARAGRSPTRGRGTRASAGERGRGLAASPRPITEHLNPG